MKYLFLEISILLFSTCILKSNVMNYKSVCYILMNKQEHLLCNLPINLILC